MTLVSLYLYTKHVMRIVIKSLTTGFLVSFVFLATCTSPPSSPQTLGDYLKGLFESNDIILVQSDFLEPVEDPYLAFAKMLMLIQSSDTDLVYIGVPPEAHGSYARTAIAAGKAVFCEKPLGIDLSESRDLVKIVEARGVPQAVNLSLAAACGVTAMREALASSSRSKESVVPITALNSASLSLRASKNALLRSSSLKSM